MYKARVFFDAGSGGVLWMTSAADQDRWGHPVDLDTLPISQPLRDELDHLIAWYDTSLNWAYPPDPGPWREAECVRFNQAVDRAIDRLREELGPGWTVVDETGDLHEDPGPGR